MKIRRILTAGAVTALLITGVPSAAMADDDVNRKGNYTLSAGRTIDGNLTVRDGNVFEKSTGNLYVYRGAKVEGNTYESGSGKRINR